MCVGCKEKKGKKDLIRIVRTPEAEILVDPTGKKAGRGAYICPEVECLNKAVKSKALERALAVNVSPEIISNLENQLKNEEPRKD
ncbi:RNase P modulator RnpM [Zhaonella formicivorans]|uniref:RNase P modulator RnpM n=1 Tax=Zhaonella formicivorans TaxID=2528593 RepID=UPI0010D1150C